MIKVTSLMGALTATLQFSTRNLTFALGTLFWFVDNPQHHNITKYMSYIRPYGAVFTQSVLIRECDRCLCR